MSDSSQPPVVCNEEEKDSKKEIKSKTEGSPECAVCLQASIHPVQLPCSHIFCYLCVKGVTNQSKRCAMCRQEIPTDFLDNPHLLSGESVESDVTFEDGYQWFYEGRNGWWQYDERTSVELETAYKRGENRCEVLIAGFLYIINFEHMIQMRRCDPTRRRHIKRDLATVPKKGVAGIRIASVHTNVNTTGELNTLSSSVSEESPTDETDRIGQPVDSSGDSQLSSNSERQYNVGHSRMHSAYGQECSEGPSGSISSHHTLASTSIIDSVSSLSLSENTSQRNQVANNGSSLRSDTSYVNEEV